MIFKFFIVSCLFSISLFSGDFDVQTEDIFFQILTGNGIKIIAIISITIGIYLFFTSGNALYIVFPFCFIFLSSVLENKLYNNFNTDIFNIASSEHTKKIIIENESTLTQDIIKDNIDKTSNNSQDINVVNYGTSIINVTYINKDNQ